MFSSIDVPMASGAVINDSCVLITSNCLAFEVPWRRRLLIKCEGVSAKLMPSVSSQTYVKGLALTKPATSINRVLSSSKLKEVRPMTFFSARFTVWMRSSKRPLHYAALSTTNFHVTLLWVMCNKTSLALRILTMSFEVVFHDLALFESKVPF